MYLVELKAWHGEVVATKRG
ncbi:hypothetical protein [Nocardia farcinica]